MLFDHSSCLLQVFAVPSERLSSPLEQKTLVDVGGPLNGEKGVGTAAFDCSAYSGDALHYMTHFVAGCIHSLLLYCNCYSEGEKLCELLQYVLKSRQLPQLL